MPLRNSQKKTRSIPEPSKIEIGSNNREDSVRRHAAAVAAWKHLGDLDRAYRGKGLRSLPTWPRRRMTIQQIAASDERELTQRFSDAAKALPLFGKGRISAVRPGESEKGMDEMATSRDK